MIKQPAVAGLFYPAGHKQLHDMVSGYLTAANCNAPAPKAIIVPHAGYIYSGSVAASAYARLKQQRDQIKRVVLIGPSHRLAFHGLAVSSADIFATPLGNIPVDKAAIKNILQFPFAQFIDQAHSPEHCLEVQLPFLQEVLDDFTIVPLVAGDAKPEQIGHVINVLWGGGETLIVISSDLSHYHDYATAQRLDKATSALIENLDYEQLDYNAACGRIPIAGLLHVARRKNLTVETIDLRNSGDTAGDKSRVVGYGAYVIN